jgi:hypothetical protein
MIRLINVDMRGLVVYHKDIGIQSKDDYNSGFIVIDKKKFFQAVLMYDIEFEYICESK